MTEPYLRVNESEKVTVVGFPEGAELDAVTVERMSHELFALIENEPRNVVVDFGNLDFLSSQALGTLLTVRLKAARVGSEVVLAQVPSKFDDIFQLTNFKSLYQIFGTLDEAREHFGAAAS